MSTELAKLVSEAAGLGTYVYWVFGLVAGWLVRWFVPSAPKPLLFRIPEPHFFPLFLFVWLFSSLMVTFLGVYKKHHFSYEVTPALKLVLEPVQISTLVTATIEELVRVGFFALCNGTFIAGIVFNNMLFGFLHLDYAPDLIAAAPLLILFWTLGAGAFGFALLAIALRFGIIWAILLHFLVNSGRIILVASDMVFNYAIFAVSTVLLAYLGYRTYREYLSLASSGSGQASEEVRA
ncbi:hypothetical protein [Meiothermus sp. CFH 77666]|uniref:hypothetical protein n=1 Tax=Meiothermus sp. CFH 77666 TaxID=2817942 RepID=UPI001AA09B5D|nr:hypothetical protein [Meiothermus sp. CFH 77666]MBO1438545.1 hypothetical protein [Meiothermus sp. CFH 77666]